MTDENLPTSRECGTMQVHRRLLDTDVDAVTPGDGIGTITRLLATYNLTAVPVVDEGLLVGAVSVDDVLDHLLPEDWREASEEETDEALEARHG